MRRLITFAVVTFLCLTGLTAKAQDQKPNIMVILGDDIGTTNTSFNSRGLMGYRTPNIDRIAHEGISHTDYDRQQSLMAENPPATDMRAKGQI